MNRLLVNPGTPQAWEIQLKPGVNRIGRTDENDFTIPHSSVSSNHCEIVMSDGTVRFRDLGSTNGSFVNRARVTELTLQHGQHLQLGSVDLVFESEAVAAKPVVRVVIAPAAVAAPAVASGEAAIPIPPPPRPVSGLRVAGVPHAEAAAATPPVASASVAHAPSPHPAPLDVRDAFCKSHVKTPARFFCPACRMYFCDLCVATRNTHGVAVNNCRHCGGVCTPVRVHITPSKEENMGFFARMPGAFGYPFTGSGVFMLVGGSVMYVLLHFCPIMVVIGGLWMKAWGLIGSFVIGGYLAAFLQSIVHTTATGDKEMPSMPSVTNLWDDVLLPAFQFTGVLGACFGPALTVLIMGVVNESVLASVAWIPLLFFGSIYFPMAYLAVVTLDSIKALNPMIVIPSITRVPLEYLATIGVLAAVVVLGAMGDFVMIYVFSQGLFTTSVKKFFLMIGLVLVLILFGFYLITVSVRILGLLFVTKREKLGWYGE